MVTQSISNETDNFIKKLLQKNQKLESDMKIANQRAFLAEEKLKTRSQSRGQNSPKKVELILDDQLG